MQNEITNKFPLAVRRNPFSMTVKQEFVDIGVSVSEMVQCLDIGPCAVMLNDSWLPKDRWDSTFCIGGHFAVVSIPRGGGGGGKNPLRTLLTVLVIAAVAWVAPHVASLALTGSWAVPSALGLQMLGLSGAFTLTKALVAGVLTAAGMLVVNALAPPVSLNARQLSGYGSGGGALSAAGGERSPSIAGARNYYGKYSPIPKVLGKHLVRPPYAARPYTEVAGNDQYLRVAFIIGYGTLKLESHKIGNDNIGIYEGVSTEYKTGADGDDAISLVPREVIEEYPNILLVKTEGVSTRTTAELTKEISIDFVWPSGLMTLRDSAEEDEQLTLNRTVEVGYGYRAVGGGAFTNSSVSVTANTGKTIRKNVKISVTEGQYEVQCWRITNDAANDLHDGIEPIDEVYWGTFRSITSTDPVQFDLGLARTALRIKATNQLNGVIDTYTCIATTYCLDYDGVSAWSNGYTNNPASLFREVLQGAGNRRPATDAQIDLDSLEEWWSFCDTNGFTYNAVIDFKTSVDAVLDEIAAAGCARKTYINGKHGVVIDKATSLIAQVITPLNSRDFSGTKLFYTRPHAFRVLFPNENENYEVDERIVYDDGYDAGNATIFETLELPGVTDPDQVWKLGRRHIASARLRPERFSVVMDVEHMVCQIGSRVVLAHDVPQFGVGYGRVKSLVQNSSDVVEGVVLDNYITFNLGPFVARVRFSDGTTSLINLASYEDETTNTILFGSSLAVEDAPEVNDLVVIGVTGSESQDCTVIGIEPLADLQARLTLVHYNEAIYTAAEGTIPEFDSNITHVSLPIYHLQPPTIYTIRSDEYVMARGEDGALHPRIYVSLTMKSGELMDQIVATEIAWRISDTDEHWSKYQEAGIVDEFMIDGVLENYTYDIKVRYKTANDASKWSSKVAHTVVGGSTAPNNVEILRLEGTTLRWVYATPPPDFAGFKVRHREGSLRLWAGATDAHDDLLRGTTYDISHIAGGLRTFMVKAVDEGGNESASAAFLIKDFGDPITDNIVVEEDLAAAAFLGTLTNCTVNGTDLEADDTGTLFWTGNDDTLMWSGNDAALFWTTEYLQMTYVTEYVPAASAIPSDMTLDYTVVGDPVSISYRESGSVYFWSGNDNKKFWTSDSADFWVGATGEFLAWPGVLEDITRQKYEIKFVIGGGQTRGVISELTIQLDVPDITENLEDVEIEIGGTRLPIVNTYREIMNVKLTIQDDSGDCVVVKIADKSADGPLIMAYDASLIETTCLVDAEIKGY